MLLIKKHFWRETHQPDVLFMIVAQASNKAILTSLQTHKQSVMAGQLRHLSSLSDTCILINKSIFIIFALTSL